MMSCEPSFTFCLCMYVPVTAYGSCLNFAVLPAGRRSSHRATHLQPEPDETNAHQPHAVPR